MRTAYRVWSGVAAATFVLVAAVDCSGDRGSSSSAPVAATPTYVASPSPAPVDPLLGYSSDMTAGVGKAVRRVVTYRDIEFVDGTRARVNAGDLTSESWRRCQERILTSAAHRLLDGKTVTVGRDPSLTYSTQDWVRLRDYAPYEGATGETDYTSALSNETTTKVMDQCYPKTEPAPAEESSGTDVYVDSDDDNHRDGALTGGYCRKKWWC